MAYIELGKPMQTHCGTIIRRFLEDGILYKSINFENSTNKTARQQGLIERVVKYDLSKRPVEFIDNFVRTTVLPEQKKQKEYPAIRNIAYKQLGDIKETSCGTRFRRYIENGILYKYFSFSGSKNKIAKKQGLIYRTVKYGTNLRPAEYTDMLKVKTILPVKEIKQPKNSVLAKTNIKTEDDDLDFGDLGANSKKSLYESYRKTDRTSVLYQDYYLFVDKVKTNIKKFNSILPEELCEDIINRYGVEEKSIRKIIQDNSFDIDKVQIMPHQKQMKTNYKHFISRTEKKEQEFAKIRLANESERLSVVYTNAWTRSNLRFDMGIMCQKRNGNTWSILREVWLKILNPEESEYKTDKLIDSFLVHMYRNRFQNKIMSFNGENPLQEFAKDKEMNKKKVLALKVMYRGVKLLGKEDDLKILKSRGFQEFKKSADIKAMAKTIEDFEEHYKNAFLKCFWTDERKFIFKETLKNECEEFAEKIDLSNDLYEALVREATIN